MVGTARHKVALTAKANGSVASSVDGGAVQTASMTGYTPGAFTTGSLAVTYDGRIRSLAIYAARPDGALPALSAL